MSSGFSDKSHLQVDSDFNKKSEENPLVKPNERKSQFNRSQSFGGWTNFREILLSNSPKTSPGIRLVWRRNSSDELGNLSKVLNIPARTFKRNISPSPKSLASATANCMSTETVSRQQQASTTVSLSCEPKCTTNPTNITKRKNQNYQEKRKENPFKDIKMPSVKSLKSLFEKFPISPSNLHKTTSNSKRSLTLAGHELSYINDLTKLKDQENKKATNDLKENGIKSVPFQKDIKTLTQKEEKSKEIDKSEKENASENLNNIEGEHLKSVRSLKLLFERSQSVPSNLNQMSLKNKITTPISRAKSIQNHLTSITISKKQSPVYEVSENANPELRKDDILTPRESVLSLKKKWESLANFEVRKGKLLPSMHKEKSIKIKSEIENNHTFEGKKLNKSGRAKIGEIENFVHSDKALLQPVSDSTQNFIHNISMTEEKTMKSNSANSVEALTASHENNKDVKSSCSDLQSTPEISANSKNDPSNKTCKESSLPHLITSIEINCYPPSKSLKEKWEENTSDGINISKTKKSEHELNINASKNLPTAKETVIDPINNNPTIIKNRARQEPFERLDKYDQEPDDTHKIVGEVSEARESEPNIIPNSSSPQSPEQRENINIHQILKTSFLKLGRMSESEVKKIQNKDIYSESLEKEIDLERSKADDSDKILRLRKGVKINRLVEELLRSESLSNNQYRSSKPTKEHENKYSDELILKNERETKTNPKTTNQECKQSEYLQINKPDGQDQISQSKSEATINSFHTTSEPIHAVEASTTLSSDKGLHDQPKITISQDFTSSKYEISDEDIKISLPSSINLNSALTPSSIGMNRSCSRDLKPDEIKFFQHTIDSNEGKTPPCNARRQRSMTIDSSPVSSLLSSNDLVKSKLRASTRQCRDLHLDELIYFGITMNRTEFSDHSKSTVECPDLKIQERTLRPLAVNEGGRKDK